jgi:hypothetical protein
MTSTAIPAASAIRDAAVSEAAGPREAALREAIARLDVAALARAYAEDDGLVVLPDLIPPTLVAEMAAEARALAPGARRTFVPWFRKAEAVGHHAIKARAPALQALHRSPSLMALATRLAGVPLEHRRPNDAHASGLYLYNRPGDYVGWHYDDCGCVLDASFTVIAGVVDESRSRLEVELHKKTAGRASEHRSIATRPGTLAFFRGSSVYHRVTPIGPGEERISFSFVYVREGLHPKGFDRIWQTGIDTLLYFGWKGLPGRG